MAGRADKGRSSPPGPRLPHTQGAAKRAAGPASHSHPARVCSVLHPPSHAGQGILWESLAVGRGVASARNTDAGRRRRPARWTRLYASNRLRSRSSPPDEDRGRSSPRNRRWPAMRHRPARRPPPAPAARSRPSAPGLQPRPPWATDRKKRGRPVSDPGPRARAKSEPTERSAAPRPATATRRSLQPPPRPPVERLCSMLAS
jgi:hypothetical protein